MDVSALGRRLVTIPLVFALFLLAIGTLPVTLPAAALADAARDARGGATRTVLFVVWYLVCEVAGIAASFALWLGRLLRPPAHLDRERHFRLQCAWARALLAGVTRLFQLRIDVEGDDDLGPGPFLLLMRHASIADTLLAAVFVAARHGVHLRTVMKRELLWDPCLDIVGHRLPNCFVERGSGDAAREIAAVARLGRDLRAGEGVLIYPEGTRFSERKRERVLTKLAEHDPELARRARSLRHVLPPRPGGTLALLAAAPEADVVLGQHVGFERVTRVSEALSGELVGARVHVRFRRIPATRVPRDPEHAQDWLFEQWRTLDRWIAPRLPERPEAVPAPSRA